MDNIEILGLMAGTITSITFIPQVIHVYKTKSAKDISITMLLLLVLGVSMWLGYGIIVKSVSIIYTNSMVFLMACILLFFKLKYGKS